MITFFATGGTMAGKVGRSGTYAASSRAADLLDQLPIDRSDIGVVDVSTKLSFELTTADWLDLIDKLRGAVADNEVTGIVVSQGTALLEEVPYLASLFLGVNKPVVFTGSMMPAGQVGSDAQINIIDAIAVARTPSAGAYGPLVVMGRQAISAAHVIKHHKSSPGALHYVGAGLCAEIDAQGVTWVRPPRKAVAPYTTLALAGPVPIFKVGMGMGRMDLDPFVSAPLAGLVVEGFPGGGGVPAALAQPLMMLATGSPVILTARSPDGRIVKAAGGASGGGTLLAGGLIGGGALTAPRARLLLMTALANLESEDALTAACTAFSLRQPG